VYWVPILGDSWHGYICTAGLHEQGMHCTLRRYGPQGGLAPISLATVPWEDAASSLPTHSTHIKQPTQPHTIKQQLTFDWEYIDWEDLEGLIQPQKMYTHH
jgi:hypothetical protein